MSKTFLTSGTVGWTRRITLLVLGAVLSLAPARAALLIHEYGLGNALTDSRNGLSLLALGGHVTPSGYVFSANQGVSLTSPILTPSNFSVEFSFKLNDPAGLDKLIDFRSLATDAGLYQNNGALSFLPSATAPRTDIVAGVSVHVVLTRDSATNIVSGYVNGEQRFSFLDQAQLAVPGIAPQLLFFADDFTTGQRDASGGTLNYLRVFNGALTAGEVTALFAAGPPLAVPEPSTVALLSLGLAAVGASVMRRRKRARS